MCFEGPADALLLTENTQPAILAMSVAVLRLVESRGVRASFAAGHSLGEYTAHVAAGTLSFADALRTVRRRGRYMQEAVPVGEGAMAAILGLDADQVSVACAETMTALAGRVVSPRISMRPGRSSLPVMLTRWRGRASERKRSVRSDAIPLAVSAPFHCALMKPAEDRLAPGAAGAPDVGSEIPVVANVDAEPKRDARAAIDALIRQVSSPVRWEEVVKRMIAEGATTFVELGPGSVLAGLIKKIDRGVNVMSVEDEQGLEAALPQLTSHQ